MPDLPRVGDLDIDQDLRFQRREWRFERAAWAAMFLLVVAALLGLLGAGPLSDRTVSSDDGRLAVEHERFLNLHTDTTLTVRVAGDLTSDGTFRLAVDNDYLAGVEVTGITPEPERQEAADDRTAFVFRVADPGRPARVTIRLQPIRPGSARAEVAVGGSAATFPQTVYP